MPRFRCGTGSNSEGKMVRFDNEPSTFDAYFKAFPKFKEKTRDSPSFLREDVLY